MFDLGWTELLLIGIVALIVVGPKDLPVLFRNVGRFVGKARGMAREFSSAMNQAADEAGVKDVAKTLKTATNPVGTAMDGVKDAAKSFKDWDPASETGKLAADRAEAARKIHEATAARQAEKRAAEESAAKAEANTETTPATETAKPAAKKAPAKKAPTKRAPAKKAPAKKAAAKPASKAAKAPPKDTA